MKKSELIAKLQAIPGDPEVAILDYITNLNWDSGEGSAHAIYPSFEVLEVRQDELPDNQVPWIALSFQNEYVQIELDIVRREALTWLKQVGLIEFSDRPEELDDIIKEWNIEVEKREKSKQQIDTLVLPNDKVFYDSADSGHSACKCSRCDKLIPAEHAPILRIWPTGPGDHGYDANASGGTEFRYCWSCSKDMGVDFGEPDPEPEDNVIETPERTCRVCGCTDLDCRQCIEKTGSPCHWVGADLCSACV